MHGGEVEADAADEGAPVLDVGANRRDSNDVDVVALDRKVDRDDRRPARGKRIDELALRTPHAFEGLDELEMHRPDVRDDPDLWARDLAQRGDLPEAAHCELEHAPLRLGLEPAERERHADL